MKRAGLGSLSLALFGIVAGLARGEVTGAQPWKPEPGKSAGWVRKADYLNRLAVQVDPEICFVGDSLTEFWNAQGSPVWQLEFQNTKAANLGMAADRTENILWRLKDSALEKIHPKLFVLMLGTNNLSKTPPDAVEDVASGVAAVVKRIQVQFPGSHILLLSILPNGHDPESGLRKRIVQTNVMLNKLAEPGKIRFVDVHNAFLDTSGKWRRGLTVDGTHLTMRGYDVLMNLIREPLEAGVR